MPPLDEFERDLLRNDLLFVRFLKNQSNRLSTVGAVIQSGLINVHTDKPIDLRRIQPTGKLRGIGHPFVAVVESVLDTFLDVATDLRHQLRSQIAADDITAERQRKSGSFQPPFSKVHYLVEPHLAIRQLTFVNQQSGFITAL